MSDLQKIKPLAEKMFELAAELLRVVDSDETARRKFIEDLKKTCTEKLLISRVRRRQSTTT